MKPGNGPLANLASAPWRVLMVSTSYPANALDWRGVFIRHLVEALSRQDQLALELWAPPGDIPDTVAYVASESERRWLARLMTEGGIAHLFRTRKVSFLIEATRLMATLRRVYERSPPSVYHINWIQNALMLPSDGRPALVTALGTDLQLLGLPLVRQGLKRVFKNRRTVICPNAEWMVEPLSDAFGSVASVRFVPFGIAPSWFAIERTPCAEKPIWLCVSRLTKGKLGRLFDWGSVPFGSEQRELHLFGPMQEETDLPEWVHYHGPASPKELRTRWFPKAHGLVTLSQHAEGRPQVMLEAMAAGLPVIASQLPAHADIVRHGINGMLCGSAAEFLESVEHLEDLSANVNAGAVARMMIADSIGTWDDCAGRYASLYRQLVEAEHD